jgi:PAS domain S-box-containing protein
MRKEGQKTKNYVLSDLQTLAGKPEMASVSLDIKDFIKKNSFLLNVLNTAASFFFIIDFSKMEYIYVSESILNVMGYTAEEWKREGMNAAFRTLHPEDKLRLERIHKDQFAFLYSQPVSQRKDYRYSTDFRVYRKDGAVIWILTQDSFIALDESGRPSLAFEICTDVTHLKRGNVMTLSISKYDSVDGFVNEKKTYYPLKIDTTFTDREVEILQQLRLGLSSKEIAKKLFISELTVFKHRRNMIQKAGVTNTISLVNYAISNELIQ